MRKHPFFHTLVMSSVGLLDGCAESHGVPHDLHDAGPRPDAPMMDSASMLDTQPGFDAGPVLDVIVPDAAERDARPEPMDAGPDIFAVDSGGDHRMCERGWPPTKGVRACQVINEEGVAVLRCVYVSGNEMEIDWEATEGCNVSIASLGETLGGEPNPDSTDIGCFESEDTCRVVSEPGRRLLVCDSTGRTCELGPGFSEGVPNP